MPAKGGVARLRIFENSFNRRRANKQMCRLPFIVLKLIDKR